MFSQEFSCKYICQRSFWVGVLKEYPSIFLHVDLDANTGKVLKSSLSNWALFGMLPWLRALTLFDLGIFCDGVLLISRVMAQYVSMCFNMFQYVSSIQSISFSSSLRSCSLMFNLTAFAQRLQIQHLYTPLGFIIGWCMPLVIRCF